MPAIDDYGKFAEASLKSYAWWLSGSALKCKLEIGSSVLLNLSFLFSSVFGLQTSVSYYNIASDVNYWKRRV